MSPLFSIIIPVFNQSDYTKKCLESLSRNSSTNESSEIIIVDNGSTDDTQAVINSFSTRLPIKCITFERSLGFSTACNEGAKVAIGSEYVFLNNDTEPQGEWLSYLHQTLSIHRVGIVGPKLINSDRNTINHAGYVYNLTLGGFYNLYSGYPADFLGVIKRREFQALLGACLLLRKETFHSLGGFAPYGLEDIDLCLKIKEQGLRVVYEPAAEVIHHGSVTLRLSAPGSFPETDVRDFNKRWPSTSLISDDENYYREDGCTIDNIEGMSIKLIPIVDISMKSLGDGMNFLASGDINNAERCFKDAVDTFTGNQAAYEELVMIYLNTQNVSESVSLLQKMSKKLYPPYESMLMLAKLYRQIGAEESLRELCRELLSDWATPKLIRAGIQELYAD